MLTFNVTEEVAYFSSFLQIIPLDPVFSFFLRTSISFFFSHAQNRIDIFIAIYIV